MYQFMGPLITGTRSLFHQAPFWGKTSNVWPQIFFLLPYQIGVVGVVMTSEIPFSSDLINMKVAKWEWKYWIYSKVFLLHLLINLTSHLISSHPAVSCSCRNPSICSWDPVEGFTTEALCQMSTRLETQLSKWLSRWGVSFFLLILRCGKEKVFLMKSNGMWVVCEVLCAVSSDSVLTLTCLSATFASMCVCDVHDSFSLMLSLRKLQLFTRSPAV